MKRNHIQLVFLLLTVFTFVINAQQYDVLPVDGRNELFHDYLLGEFDKLATQRKSSIESTLTSLELTKERQNTLRNNYLKIIGDLPQKSTLRAEVVGTVNTDEGYRIEKLHYQSVPNHHVTANFYIPETGTAPYPTVIFTCGHYPVAKTYKDYQDLSILFAKNGIAVLIVDPISQGERYQITDESGNPTYVGQSGTSAHSRLDVGSVLNGKSVMAYQLWDNHRGVDYLYSRTDVVDTSKIGCAGHSGGGAQASYLLAFDKRLKVGVVANYITNETSMFKVSGPQTGSQNLSFEGENGIDQPEYITMFAPKPYMVIGTTVDGIFKIEASQETIDEAKKVYNVFGADEKVKLFETTDAHDYTKVKREATVRWFKNWFMGNNDTIVEGDQKIYPSDSLVVTNSGQVLTEFEGELNIAQLNTVLADSLESERMAFWNDHSKETCLNKIRGLIRLDSLTEVPNYESSGSIARDGYSIEKGKISYMDHVPVTSLTFIPDGNTSKLPAVLYVDGRGKDEDADEAGIIEKYYLDSGYIVMSIDVRGFGETSDNPSRNESKHGNKEHRNSVVSLYVGKTLVGQRVEDIEKAMAVLISRSDVDINYISMVGVDRASIAVLHAAALDDRFKRTTIRKASPTAWTDVIIDPTILDQMTHEVPFAMKYYNLNDLAGSISPRNIAFVKSFDARLTRITVKNGDLMPDFDSDIYNYAVTNLESNEIRLRGFLSDDNATLTGEDTYDVSSEGKTIDMVVTAEDGVTTLTYNIEIPQYVSIENIEAGNNNVMGQNYPNPFIGNTIIAYEVEKACDVLLNIYAQDGRLVKSLNKAINTPGEYEFVLNASNFVDGIYMYKLYMNGNYITSRKMIVDRK